MDHNLINVAYLIAAVLFILGLKGLTHPRTAVRGNLLGALGMLIAIVAVLVDKQVAGYGEIFAALLIGSAIGAIFAQKVEMTAMPQMVALFNGFGGIASALVAAGEYAKALHQGISVAGRYAPMEAVAEHVPTLYYQFNGAVVAAAIIGAVTFTGSLVAFAKLQELVSGNPIAMPGGRALNALLLLAAVGVGVALVMSPSPTLFWVIIAISAVLGVTLVVPVGGADMPVVIALLNSYSGLAAAAAGFVLGNTALIVSGSLVGSSGIILTKIMCDAMNRSLGNVLFGAAESFGKGASADEVYGGKIKSTSGDELAIILESASRVVFVPGYGMAVAQAQHAVRELMTLLEERGVEVEFAIHPVAGRMPGHMNVLLAEADVPYDQLIEMEEINPTFGQVDVAIVLGANDVVNPVARTDPQSPIAGMPIIDVDKARLVVVIKRSLSPGFAGIPNPLFALDNTLMFFKDGKGAILEINQALKEG